MEKLLERWKINERKISLSVFIRKFSHSDIYIFQNNNIIAFYKNNKEIREFSDIKKILIIFLFQISIEVSSFKNIYVYKYLQSLAFFFNV